MCVCGQRNPGLGGGRTNLPQLGKGSGRGREGAPSQKLSEAREYTRLEKARGGGKDAGRQGVGPVQQRNNKTAPLTITGLQITDTSISAHTLQPSLTHYLYTIQSTQLPGPPFFVGSVSRQPWMPRSPLGRPSKPPPRRPMAVGDGAVGAGEERPTTAPPPATVTRQHGEGSSRVEALENVNSKCANGQRRTFPNIPTRMLQPRAFEAWRTRPPLMHARGRDPRSRTSQGCAMCRRAVSSELLGAPLGAASTHGSQRGLHRPHNSDVVGRGGTCPVRGRRRDTTQRVTFSARATRAERPHMEGGEGQDVQGWSLTPTCSERGNPSHDRSTRPGHRAVRCVGWGVGGRPTTAASSG